MKRVVLFAISIVFVSCAVAMPSRNDLKKVQATVNELMAEDIAAMKGGKQSPEGAAKKAEELAGLATDEASKFLLLKGAFGLYVEGGKYDAALAALETLKAQVKDVPDKVLADIVRAKMKKVSKKDGGTILSYYAQLDRRMRSAAEKAKFAKAVKENPSDKVAHRQLAFATAVLDGWPAALAEFALAGGGFATAAKAEQVGKMAEAADLWWNLSDDEDEQAVLREHAAGLYRQAMDGGKLEGLKLALAKKRIAEFGAEPSASPAPTAVAPETARPEGKAIVLKAEAASPAKVRAQGQPMSLDLGKGVRLNFVNCPAGDMSVTSEETPSAPFRYTITRPFWIGQIPVTRRQLMAVYGTVPFDEYEKLNGKSPFAGNSFQAVDKLRKLHGGEDSVWFGNSIVSRRFCLDLTAKFKRQLPRGYVIREPSVAEWLYAYFAGMGGSLGQIQPTKERSLHFEHGEWHRALEWLQANGLQPNADIGSQTRAVELALIGGKPRQMAPNAWQVHDLDMCHEHVLDQFDLRQSPKVRYDEYKFVLNPWGCTFGDEKAVRLAGVKDPFFCSKQSLRELAVAEIGCLGKCRRAALCMRLGGEVGPSHLRLVIGPDLEKERGVDHSSDQILQARKTRTRDR